MNALTKRALEKWVEDMEAIPDKTRDQWLLMYGVKAHLEHPGFIYQKFSRRFMLFRGIKAIERIQARLKYT